MTHLCILCMLYKINYVSLMPSCTYVYIYTCIDLKHDLLTTYPQAAFIIEVSI